MKILIDSMSKYREVCFTIMQAMWGKKYGETEWQNELFGMYHNAGKYSYAIEETLDIKMIHEVWTVEDGIELDEDGNPYPDDYSTPDKLVFSPEGLATFVFPFVLVVNSGWLGNDFIHTMETVYLKDFISHVEPI